MHAVIRNRIAAFGFAAALLAGIAQARPTGQQAAQSAATPPAAPRIVTDEAGRRVSVPVDVRRIVSLAPNLTETVYALGLGDRLAGDTNYCDTPPDAKSKPHVGGPLNPSLEAIVALHPDLVLATTSINRRETVDALDRLGIAVYSSDPHTVRGLLDSTERMADLMGAGSQGASLVAQLRMRLDTLHDRLAERPLVHVLFVVWENPLISIGQNTFIADALRWGGAESVVLSQQNWPQVSFEEVVRLEPDYLVFAGDPSTSNAQLAKLRAEDGWKSLGAVQDGHIVILSEEVDRPSPGLIDAIEQLAHELHPEVFGAQRLREPANFAVRVIPAAAQPSTECILCAR